MSTYDWLEALAATAGPPQLIDAARDLAASAWGVFPCHWSGPKAKSPLTAHGHLDATMDPDVIKAWWTRWPDAMIGAAVPDSCIVIDVDPRNGGNLAELERLTGPLPATLTAWSGRNDGGRHLYFVRPPGPLLTSTRLPNGIDLKTNGYCIVPPSIHPATGQPYRWEERTPADLPAGLLNLLQVRPESRTTSYAKPTAGALAGLLRTVADAQEGSRNRVLYWAACRSLNINTGRMPPMRSLTPPEPPVSKTAKSPRRSDRQGFDHDRQVVRSGTKDRAPARGAARSWRPDGRRAGDHPRSPNR